MYKIFLYLKTSTFRKNVLYALLGFVGFFLLLYVGLRVYTKHGDQQEVPVLKGLHISEAIQVLKEAGLEYKIDSVYQMDAKPGIVIEQDPQPQVGVKGGRTIYLTIITETAPEIGFPDVVGKTLVEAMAIIKNNSLRIGDTTYVNDIATNMVLKALFAGQQITPGRVIPKGSRIDLVLGNGRGADQVTIPDLIGMPYADAEFALRGVGLVVGGVTFEGEGRDTLNAIVTGQSPDISQVFISLGSAVHLTLSNAQ